MSRAFDKLGNGLLVMIATGILAAVAYSKGLFSSETASWVQGLGSVGALIGLVWSTRVAVRRDRERSDEDRLTRAVAAHQAAAQVQEAIAEAKRSIAPGAPIAFSPENFDSLRFGLQQIDVMQLPTAKVVKAVFNLRRAVHFFEVAYKMAIEAKRGGRPVPPNVAAELAKWETAVSVDLEAIEAEALEIFGRLDEFEFRPGQ